MSFPYRKLLTPSKTGKELAERLLEFFTAFVMLWIGWKTIGWIVFFFEYPRQINTDLNTRKHQPSASD